MSREQWRQVLEALCVGVLVLIFIEVLIFAALVVLLRWSVFFG